MLNQFSRQLRRLILAALVICGAFWISYQHENASEFGPGIAALIVSFISDKSFFWTFIAVISIFISVINAGLMLMPTLFIIFAARWRNVIERAVLGFIVALCVIAIKELSGIPTYGSTEAIWWIAAFLVLYLRLYDRVLPKLRYTAKESYTSAKPAAQLWAELVPLPAFADQHWDKKLVNISQSDEDSNTVFAKYNFGKFEIAQDMQVLTHSEPYHFAYDYSDRINGKPANVGGTYDIRIDDNEFTRTVTLQMQTSKLPFSTWMSMWFGDILGDITDHLRSLETGKRDYSTTGAVMRHAVRRRQRGAISPNARPA